MPTQLEQLKRVSTVVADTGDLDAIQQYQPIDATTNPSLILKASQLPVYSHLLLEGVKWAKAKKFDDILGHACDWLSVQIGKRILEHIPGKVSTEIDARLSFDTQATIKRAYDLIELYHKQGIEPDKVLIKIASTWEGINAASALEKEGIHCNLTLLFSLEQAKACADAGVFLISPFVGRITDWYKKHNNIDHYTPEEDPGVLSVKNIYNHYKTSGYKTVIMAASFRNTDQITALAGCDRLTISPVLLDTMAHTEAPVNIALNAESAVSHASTAPLNEAAFRWHLNENTMATEKLAEGIRLFAKDIIQLEKQLRNVI